MIATAALMSWRLSTSAGTAAEATTVGCSQMEELGYHVHVHLAILVEGEAVPVPGGIGIRPGCVSWLHTHGPDGVVHVEAPAPRAYRLGDFFAVWERPLGPTRLLDRTADGTRTVVAHVNGRRYAGPPESIPLEAGSAVVLQYGPPFVPLP